ncbi:MAG: hypothetical protein CL927_13780 [Deltaproteobacteria bacterium]|nr:hypothetical protein [Deltaproteobacteria bacterium]
MLLHGLTSAGADQLDAFQAARTVAQRHTDTQPAVLVTVQNTGGAFGTTPFSLDLAWSGGVAALARTFAQEHPTAPVKAIDLDTTNRDLSTQAQMLAHEIVAGGPELEVGLPAQGSRLTLTNERVVTQPKPTASIGPEDVIVVSGGARGVTARTVIELGRATGARFVLLGRTPLADEPAAAHGVPTDDARLKAALLKAAMQRGERVHPRDLGKQVKRILAGREIRGTLEALAQTGASARYDAVDVTDSAGQQSLFDEVSQSWGPVTGIIHGAGVIRDRFIREKSDEDFTLVVRTKLAGLRALLDARGAAPLKLLLPFSSVAARTGNVGQVDYAMANEVLNRVCDALAHEHPEAVIRSLGWGPWEAGMVTPALKARFEALGVPLISLDTGARMLVNEVFHGPGAPTSVVLGGEPRPEALLNEGSPPPIHLDAMLSPETHPWLVDHTVAGVPVVPVALVVDQMLSAARGLFPGHTTSRLTDLKVHKGIRLEQWPEPTHLALSVQDMGDGTLAMALNNSTGQPLYRATVDPRPTAQALAVPQLDLPSRDGAVYDGTLLFHGPSLQVLANDVCVDASGATAGLRSSPLAGTGAVDVGAVDGALQLALLWAQAATGGASLPMGIDELCLHQSSLDDTTGLVLTRRSASGPSGSADIVLVNANGEAAATLRGVRTIRRPDVPRA